MPQDFVAKVRRYDAKKLTELHHNILRLHMLGYKGREIAEKLGCSTMTVSNALNSSLGRFQTSIIRAELDGTAVEAAKQIRQLAPKAIRLIEEVMDDDEAPISVRLRAAQDALDRAGFAAVKKVDMRNTSVSLTKDDLESLKQAALERAQASGLVVDVESFEESQDIASPPVGYAEGL